MKKLLLLFFGLSLFIGLISGYFTSEINYFYLDMHEPKHEITIEKYNEIMNSHNIRLFGDPKALKKEKVYNLNNALIIGIGSFSLFCILNYFIKLEEKIK